MEKGRAIGLVSDERYERFLADKAASENEIARLNSVEVTPTIANKFLEAHGSAPLDNRISLAQLLKRAEFTYDELEAIDPGRPQLLYHVRTKVEVAIKYEGYIDKQLQQIEHFKKLETKLLPQDVDYMTIEGIRMEAREKLNQFKPVNVGQASRISGVSPADINVLIVYLEKSRRS